MSRRFSYRAKAPVLALILSGLLASRMGGASDRTSSADSTVICTQMLMSLASEPLKLGSTLFGTLPEVELNSILTPPTRRPTVELANGLIDLVAAEASKTVWHREIPSLYQSIRSFPGLALSDLVEERGLDQGLWESVVQNFEIQNHPFDHERAKRATQWIKQGLGYLNFTGSGRLAGASPRLKAQFISQIVIGRFGTAPWNAAGKWVDQALPVAEREEVFKFLKESPAAEHGFFPAFDTLSGEWGMEDLETGLIWFNATRSQVSWEEAIAYCKSKNQSLPSREQWQMAENHRIREVFPEMRTRTAGGLGHRFLSSTPAGVGLAYVFQGSYGNAGSLHYRDNSDYNVFSDDNVFARCVSAERAVKR